MTSIRTMSIRIAIAILLAAGAALAGATAAHPAAGTSQGGPAMTAMRPAGIVDCCV